MIDFKAGQRYKIKNNKNHLILQLQNFIDLNGEFIIFVLVEKCFYSVGNIFEDGLYYYFAISDIDSLTRDGWICIDNDKNMVSEERSISMCLCKRCNTINEWAEPNQKDGSFICYNCRS